MGRFYFSWDMNGDGVFTIADVGWWARWLFTLPGDVTREAIINHFPAWAQFWEMEHRTPGGLFGFFWSIPIWLILWGAIASERNKPPRDEPPKPLY